MVLCMCAMRETTEFKCSSVRIEVTDVDHGLQQSFSFIYVS